MAIETVACPVCGQKLGIIDYVMLGTEVVCATPGCLTSLRVVRRNPLRVELVPIEKTFNAHARPESYG